MSDVADRQRWLRFLGTPDCPCPSEWRSLGNLDGISMGKGWVRMATDPNCRHHAVCRGCRHSGDDHRLDDALNVSPVDSAAEFRCVYGDCECPNFEATKETTL